MRDDMLDELELKMIIYVMTLIIAVGRNMKFIITLNLCLMPLKKILEINYTYGYLKQPTEKNLVEGNNIFYISDNR